MVSADKFFFFSFKYPQENDHFAVGAMTHSWTAGAHYIYCTFLSVRLQGSGYVAKYHDIGGEVVVSPHFCC